MKSQTNPMKENLLSHNFANYSFIDDRIQKQQEDLVNSLHEKIKKRKKYRKIAVGNPTGFDITQFFTFKKKETPSDSLIDQLSGGHLAWLILVYCMVNNSLVLPWMMVIDADKFLRLAWRHMFLNVILLPFIFYEKRKATPQTLKLYQIQNILKPSSLMNAMLVSLSKGFWFIIITSTFQYVTVAHTLILGNLMNLFLSINRFLNQSYHFLEPGGQIFIIVGIILILKDQIMMDTQIIDTSYRMIGFASYSWHFRISIDFLALFVSFVMAISYKYTTNLNKDYPSYLGMFIVNSMIAVIMFLASYFMHGASFDNDENFGIFGLFTGSHFSTFLQMSIFIGFGMLWSYAMISNLFPDPLLPSLSALFEPIMSISTMDFIGLQQMPSGYTVMGYIFIIPGSFLILIGQNIFQKVKKNEEKQLEQRIKSIVEMSLVRKQTLLSQVQSPLMLTTLKKSTSDLRGVENSETNPYLDNSRDNETSLKMMSLKLIPTDSVSEQNNK